MRALERWIKAAAITQGPVFRRIWRQKGSRTEGPPSLPRVGDQSLSDRAVALIVQARAAAAGFGAHELGGHSLKRGRADHGDGPRRSPNPVEALGRHKSYDVLGEYMEFGDLFEGHPLTGVL